MAQKMIQQSYMIPEDLVEKLEKESVEVLGKKNGKSDIVRMALIQYFDNKDTATNIVVNNHA